MKKLIQLILILGIALSAFHCQKKKDDNNKNLLLLLGLYVADQQSGNCALVTKSGNTYTASLYPIPKGGCNAGTIVGGTTVAEIKNKLKADYARYISIIDAEFSSECVTTEIFFQAALQNDSALETSATSTYNMHKDARYYVIGNLVQEAKNVLINANPNDEIASEADVNTLSPASVDEFKKFYDYFWISIFASSVSDSTCTTAVGNKISQTFPSDKYSLFGSPKKNTKMFSAICSYGDGANPQFKCSTLNEKF